MPGAPIYRDTVPGATPVGTDLFMRSLRRWSLVDLPRINDDIVAGRDRPATLVGAFNAELAQVMAPERFSAEQARQLLVQFGMAGTSVTRHYQQADAYYQERPEYPLDLLTVGPERIPFRQYYLRLAEHSGTRHPQREAYASLVRWNVPAVEVYWHGQLLITNPSAFGDGHTMTYTGEHAERLLWELLKKCEGVELAVNGLLGPLSDGTVGFRSREAIDRIVLATELVVVIRRLMRSFTASGSAEEPALTPDYLPVLLRRFGVHWEVGDVPPSGLQDPEFVVRDLLLGVAFPGHHSHVRGLFPGLLGDECDRLGVLLGRRPLPVELLAVLGIGGPAEFAALSPVQLASVAVTNPVMVAMYLLLRENARLSGAHLQLATGSQPRAAEADGDEPLPDEPDEPASSIVHQLTRGRRNHALAALGQVPLRELAKSAGIAQDHVASSTRLDDVVRFAKPAT